MSRRGGGGRGGGGGANKHCLLTFLIIPAMRRKWYFAHVRTCIYPVRSGSLFVFIQDYIPQVF